MAEYQGRMRQVTPTEQKQRAAQQLLDRCWRRVEKQESETK